MDPRFLANSSNGFQWEIQSPNTDSVPKFEITYPGRSLAHSSQEQNIRDLKHSSLQYELPFDCDSTSDEILRYIDRRLMDKTYVLQASLDFQTKKRCLQEDDVLGKKYPSQDDNSNYYYFDNRNLSTSITDASGYLIGCNIVPPTDGVNINSCFASKLLDINEARSDKLPEVPTEEFDDDVCDVYTLGGREKEFSVCFKDLKIAANKQLSGEAMKARKSCGKKQKGREVEVVDLKYLLMNCAKSMASDNHGAVVELLTRIRLHSSPNGDGNQRLAHYFANGLEARLAGTGIRAHGEYPTSASDNLRVYCISLMSFCIRKVSNFASSKMIAIRSKKETRVHVIDFGISYGFQWPLFIRRLGGREGGPPKLRITGVDFPQPAENIEETGLRLARYAKAFGVPFEYNAIACKWESIKVEDLKIEEGEFVAVNCLFGCKNLLDERGDSECSKGTVLKLIRSIDPDIFVHGIVNGGYGVPFFASRFWEALYHFSALFDMLDTVVPRERHERMVIERDMLGSEIMNVIACEGSERVEWPETYKKWQGRHLKSGFRQLRFGRELTDSIMLKVGNRYNGDFVVEEDTKWLLLCWKGRITHAISCWQSSKD